MQPELSEADLALVHALQHRPRAAWSELAPVLGVSAATLAARWHRLRADGLSWVTAYPVAVVTGPSLVALVEVDCAAGTVTEVSTR
ncbi:MAG TPA: Lrp/AsnC family transcriptional regulator, partial [Streptomyces sp.]|nr:Lrp/AsnC family transcriptional regulator [Streptomyces sp.]